MADNPFADYITPYTGQPNAATTDMTRELIKQLGERRSSPKFEGPGAWWGAVADMSRDFSQQQLMQKLQKQTEAINPAPGMGAARGAQQPPPGPGSPRTTGVQPTPGVAPISGGGGTAGAVPSVPLKTAEHTGKGAPEAVKSTGELAASAGETPPEEEGGETKVAQSAPNAFATPKKPGGSALATPRLETPEEFQKNVDMMWRNHYPPQAIQDYNQDYIKRSQQERIKTPGGAITLKPDAGGGAQEGFEPRMAEGLPFSIEGLNAQFVPEYDEDHHFSGGTLMMPGGETKRFSGNNAIADAIGFMQELKARGEFVKKKAEAVSDEVSSSMKEGLASGPIDRTLSTMQALNADPAIPRGPTSDYSIKAREFLDNIHPNSLPKGAPPAEVFKKLNFYLAADISHGLSSRVSNFSLSAAMQNNPGLMQTQAGTAMLIDLMRQEQQLKAGLARKAIELQPKDMFQWQQIQQDYYKEHYPILHQPGKPDMHLSGWDTSTDEGSAYVKSKLKPGEVFLRKDGKLMQNPTEPALRGTTTAPGYRGRASPLPKTPEFYLPPPP